MIGAEAHYVPTWLLTLVGALDFPFSLLLDTLLLPLSIPLELFRADPESHPEKSE